MRSTVHTVEAFREKLSDHPMRTFAVSVALAIAAIAFAPSSISAFAAVNPSATGAENGERTTQKTDRLAPVSETQRACTGQAWGHENSACLDAIMRETSKDTVRRIRMVTDAK